MVYDYLFHGNLGLFKPMHRFLIELVENHAMEEAAKDLKLRNGWAKIEMICNYFGASGPFFCLKEFGVCMSWPIKTWKLRDELQKQIQVLHRVHELAITTKPAWLDLGAKQYLHWLPKEVWLCVAKF